MGTDSLKMKQLNNKFNISKLLLFSGVYLLATVVMIIFLTQHTLKIDTENLTVRAYAVADILNKNPQTKFDDSVLVLPLSTQSKAVENIKNGARFTRSLSQTSMTVTIPNYQDAVLKNYIQITRERSSDSAVNGIIIAFTTIIYLIWIYQLYTSAKKLHQFETDTIAKIKNIRRSPLTQSYLISENDDKVTTALNHLGESIQHKAESSTPAKKNLYEFIELFEFPIFIYDLKGTIRRSNASFKNEFADTKNLDIFSPYSDVLQFLVNKMLKPGQQEHTFYFEQLNAYYTMNVRPIQSLDHRLMVTMIDVTTYKATTIAHNDFIANVSHDLKTPLTAIAGFADILVNDLDKLSTSDAKVFAKHIVKETKRLSTLVADTLEMTRQPLHLKKTKLNLSTQIDEVLTNFEFAIKDKQLTLTKQYQDKLYFKSNEKHLYAILKNLIENAINYTPSGGKIFISASKIDKKLTFTISDNGPGLTAIETSRIFERFYRADHTRDSEGTGLGLAIVKKNLAELGGHIDVVSVLDKGTTFTVTF